MADEVVEVSYESWGGRIVGSLFGLIFGLLFIPAAIVLLFWNEGRAAKTTSSLKEAESVVVQAMPDAINPANEHKLVHITGQASTPDQLQDGTFGITVNAIRLVRHVEMYQWNEKKNSDTTRQLFGGEKTTSTYTYAPSWAEKLIDSSKFKKTEGHANPSTMLATKFSVEANQVALGSYQLPLSVIFQMPGEVRLELTDQNLASLPSSLRAKAKIAGDAFFFGNDPVHPVIGDQRASFDVVNPGVFSIVAQQAGNSLEPYPTHVGRDVLLVESGNDTSDIMFHHAESENKLLTIALRAGGTFVMFLGFSLVLKPIQVLGDVIPLVGSVIDLGIGVAAFLLALVASGITVSLAWIAATHPILAVILAVLVIASLFFIKRPGERTA